MVSGVAANVCRPCGRRDPYAVPLVLRDAVRRRWHKLRPAVVRPRLRGDDDVVSRGCDDNRCRPCGRRDPYAVPLVLKVAG
jgi:hypothetical protein